MGVIIGLLVAYIAYRKGYDRGYVEATEELLMLED